MQWDTLLIERDKKCYPCGGTGAIGPEQCSVCSGTGTRNNSGALRVSCGDRYEEGLRWDEALGVVAAMLATGKSIRLLTNEEHAAFDRMLRGENKWPLEKRTC